MPLTQEEVLPFEENKPNISWLKEPLAEYSVWKVEARPRLETAIEESQEKNFNALSLEQLEKRKKGIAYFDKLEGLCEKHSDPWKDFMNTEAHREDKARRAEKLREIEERKQELLQE